MVSSVFAQAETSSQAQVPTAVAMPQFNQDFQFKQSVFQPMMPKEAAQDEMMFAQMGNIVFQKFSYQELGAMCPNEDKIVTAVYDYLEGQDIFANMCSGIEEGLQKCTESKSFCENIGRPPDEYEQDEEQKAFSSCPPDEAKLAQLCTDRATSQQEEQSSYIKEEIPIKCELEWERNQFHYQSRCNEGTQQSQGQGYNQGQGSQGNAYGSSGPGMGPGGQGYGGGSMCPNISPPAQDEFKRCSEKQGHMEKRSDDKGCIVGFECVQGQYQPMGPNTGCRSAPQEEIDRQKNECYARNGRTEDNWENGCMVGVRCIEQGQQNQYQPPPQNPETGPQPGNTEPTDSSGQPLPGPGAEYPPTSPETTTAPPATGTEPAPAPNPEPGTTLPPTGNIVLPKTGLIGEGGAFPIPTGPQGPDFYNPSGPAATMGQPGYGPGGYGPQGPDYGMPGGPGFGPGMQGPGYGPGMQGPQGYGPGPQQGFEQGRTYAPGTGPNYGPNNGPGMQGPGGPQGPRYGPPEPSMSQGTENQMPKETFCDKDKFLAACGEMGNKAFASNFQKTNVKRICELEAKLNAKQMQQFCKQAQNGKAECVKRTEQACKFVSKQLEKCKSYSTPEKIKSFIKAKAHEMCVSKQFNEQKTNYDQDLAEIANSLEMSSGQLPEEYGQWMQGEKSRLVQVTEGVSEVQQQEAKQDIVYQLTKALGAQKQKEMEQAKKINDQANKLDQTITSLKALSEQLTDETMQATLNEQIRQLEERRDALTSNAREKENGASGIFGFLGGLFGGGQKPAPTPTN